MSTPRREASIGGISMKYISLVTSQLTVQNSALILIMRYSRIMPLVDGKRYFPSTAVFLNEVLKLIISTSIVFYTNWKSPAPNNPSSLSFRRFFGSLNTGDSLKLAIPAVLYTFQNTLQYVAVSNLDAATFQVTYQLKILTTALFSVTMLGRILSIRKWISLVLLMAGVAIVQLPSDTLSPSSPAPDTQKPDHARRSLVSLLSRESDSSSTGGNSVLGLVAVIIACAISGLAGVYFEKVLKDGSKNVSLWVRNVQLSFFSLFPAFFLGVLGHDGANIKREGFFAGYNWVVWTAIVFQAFGGIIVALVVNYADNIAKNFATSLSIILSFIASVYFFGLKVTFQYILGTAVVLYATYLYSSPERGSGNQPAYTRAPTGDEEHGLDDRPRPSPDGPAVESKVPPVASQTSFGLTPGQARDGRRSTDRS